jgi:aminopeptidase N
VNSWTLCAKKSEFAVLATSNQYAPSLTLEPIHLDVDLKFNIAERKAEGYVINKIRANTKDADKIVLNAIDIDIKDVSAGDSKISWDYDKKNIFIQFEDKFDLYEERSVKIGYSVNNPVAGLYFSYPNEKNPNAPITVGSDHETERARHWIPSIDSPIVRPTINFTLTSDESHTILAIGKLVNEKTNNDGTKTAFWEHNYPCPLYIAAIAIGELTEYKDRSVVLDGIERPIAYYSGKDFTSEQLKLTFDRTPEMIEWFCEKFGHSIAWTKYYQFAFRGIGGAMENQSLVSWDDMLVQDGDTIEEFKGLVDSVNVHELAHTFFGDMVVIKDFGHGWLKESWATYLSALWLEDKYNKDEFHYDMYRSIYQFDKKI